MQRRTIAISILALLSSLTATPALAQQADTSFRQWEGDIRAFERSDSAQPPAKHGILFVGSSSIRMWETLASDFPDLPVINRGFGGSELHDVAHFANRIVLPYKPRVIVVYAGDNDLANGRTPQQVLNDFRRLVRTVHRALPRTRIVFVAVKPSIARWNIIGRIREANTIVRRYTRTDTRVDFADVFTPMLGADGQPRKELFGEDGLHMTRAGYELWTRVVRPYLR
jgi:lysophospholipase L1-like esterase